MYYLGLESSAKSASVCIADGNGKLISESFVNVGLTHSETLMPMVDGVLKNAKLCIDDIDRICVSAGPGSFTGIRIGVAAAKGLAFTADKPCAGISTLHAMAYNLVGFDCVACCAMDARCGQVYTALFDIHKNSVKRLTEDIAISIEELYNKLIDLDERVFFVGDGAQVCFDALSSRLPGCELAPEKMRYQRAFGVVLAALESGECCFKPGDKLVPVYLRAPQAERELKLKRDGNVL